MCSMRLKDFRARSKVFWRSGKKREALGVAFAAFGFLARRQVRSVFLAAFRKLWKYNAPDQYVAAKAT